MQFWEIICISIPVEILLWLQTLLYCLPMKQRVALEKQCYRPPTYRAEIVPVPNKRSCVSRLCAHTHTHTHTHHHPRCCLLSSPAVLRMCSPLVLKRAFSSEVTNSLCRAPGFLNQSSVGSERNRTISDKTQRKSTTSVTGGEETAFGISTMSSLSW